MQVVIGRGWIGSKMAAQLAFRDHIAALISHEEALDFIAANHKSIQNVYNCAGFLGKDGIDECEKHPALTIAANSVFPVLLMEQCARYGIHLTHWSTGCIFDGGWFNESDTPNFDGSLYSASKLASDLALKGEALVLRIRQPFDGTHSYKNLLWKLRQYAHFGYLVESLESISDIDEMVGLAIDLAFKKEIGTFHCVNKGAITKRELAQMMGLEAKWKTLEEHNRSGGAKRASCQLLTSLNTSPVRAALTRAIRTFNGNHDIRGVANGDHRLAASLQHDDNRPGSDCVGRGQDLS